MNHAAVHSCGERGVHMQSCRANHVRRCDALLFSAPCFVLREAGLSTTCDDSDAGWIDAHW